MRHNSGSRSFTYYALHELAESFRHYEATGTVFGSINKTQFLKLQVLDPGSRLIEVFEESVSSLDARIEGNHAENETLTQTRDLLLPKLMSGEIRLRDAERMVEDAA